MQPIEIQKSEKTKIIIQGKKYQGKNFVDIRLWYQAEDESYRPTTKGVSFTPEQFQEACDLWDDILEEMAEGFLYYHEHKYDYDYENYNEHEKILSKKIERSLELFSEYFRHIWW